MSAPIQAAGNRRDFGEIDAMFVNIPAVLRHGKTIVCE
jgi:hypothetical protein